MSSSGAIRAGKAFVEIFADGTKLTEGLKQMGTKVAGWAGSLNAQGQKIAGLADKLTPVSQGSAELADRLDKLGPAASVVLKPVAGLLRGFSGLTGSAGKAVEAIHANEEAMSALSLAGTAAGHLPSLLSGLISPMGLVSLAAVGAGYAFVNFTETGKSAFSAVSESVMGLKDDAVETFDAIANAIAAGDIKAAMDVLGTSLKVIWQSAVIWLENKWLAFNKSFIDVSAEIALAFVDVSVALQQAWSDFFNKFIRDSQTMKKIFHAVADTFLGPLGIVATNALENAAEAGPDHQTAQEQRNKINELRKGTQQGLEESFASDLALKQAALEAAKEARNQALSKAKGLSATGAAAAAATEAATVGAQHAKAAAAIGANDVRTKEGFAAIAALTRGGDPQKELAQTQKDAYRLQQRQWIEERRIRERLDAITVIG